MQKDHPPDHLPGLRPWTPLGNFRPPDTMSVESKKFLILYYGRDAEGGWRIELATEISRVPRPIAVALSLSGSNSWQLLHSFFMHMPLLHAV